MVQLGKRILSFSVPKLSSLLPPDELADLLAILVLESYWDELVKKGVPKWKILSLEVKVNAPVKSILKVIQ